MNTLFSGRQWLKLQQVDSTNNYALQMIEKGKVVEGLVISTREQTAGKGQRNNSWVSPKGEGLTFSLIYTPLFLAPDEQFYLSIAVSLGCYDYLKMLVPKTHIKWPNDLIVNNKKAGGILIENILRGNQITHSVIGVGLNLNQPQHNTELPNSTSIYIETGKVTDHNEALHSLLSSIENRYLSLRSGFKKQLKYDYLQALWKIGETTLFTQSNKEISAVITNINENGELVLTFADGKSKAFKTGEIGWSW